MAISPSIEVDVYASVGIIRPGDTLIVAVDAGHSDHAKQLITERLAAELPGVMVVLVAARAFTVYRP